MNIKITNKEPTIKGPYGTSLFFVAITVASDIGKARKAESISAHKPSLTPSIIPITPASLMSPPPRASLLNIFLPKILTKYIAKNINNPARNALQAATWPKYIHFKASTSIELPTKGESRIIKYLKSDININISKDDIIKQVKNS